VERPDRERAVAGCRDHRDADLGGGDHLDVDAGPGTYQVIGTNAGLESQPSTFVLTP
jgi:hypothetical protein